MSQALWIIWITIRIKVVKGNVIKVLSQELWDPLNVGQAVRELKEAPQTNKRNLIIKDPVIATHPSSPASVKSVGVKYQQIYEEVPILLLPPTLKNSNLWLLPMCIKKMTGGTQEVRSHKSLTLLTFDIQPMDQWTMDQ